MERDILSPWRGLDIILWMWWGEVSLEHLMAITRNLGMEKMLVCVCDVKEGTIWGRATLRITQLAHVTR